MQRLVISRFYFVIFLIIFSIGNLLAMETDEDSILNSTSTTSTDLPSTTFVSPSTANITVNIQVTTENIDPDDPAPPGFQEFVTNIKTKLSSLYANISTYLKSPGFTPASEIHVIFTNCSGINHSQPGGKFGVILASNDYYFKHHRETDFLSLINAMVRIIQKYSKPPFLVYGISKYVGLLFGGQASGKGDNFFRYIKPNLGNKWSSKKIRPADWVSFLY
ncbi:uncharacterized protein LOC110842079 [Folsomia candida]|uniref:uncharacterized protein LOC110842079 n=1 Tax=Folsomia candida TaxID=158441 RepID=UPI000B906E89|nr:uncharacterized protein LOC110842079 [Folsomia candida]